MADKPQYAIWVDLQGTLCKHRKGDPVWRDGEPVIGTPVNELVRRVKHLLNKKVGVVIKTAMMSDPDPSRRAKVEMAVGDWTSKHLGQRLEVTATCRPEFFETWDDKCRRVVRNEGRFADETVVEESSHDGAGKTGTGGAEAAKGPGGRAGIRPAKADESSATERAASHFGTWSTWDDE